MALPVEVLTHLNEKLVNRWHTQFEASGNTNLEGLWRRTQNRENKDESGWSPTDQRRRIVHYIDQYDLVRHPEDVGLGLITPYLWREVVSPSDEIAKYLELLRADLNRRRWEKKESGDQYGHYIKDDLEIKYRVFERDPHDEIEGRSFPPGYIVMETTISSVEDSVSSDQKQHPWEVLKTGIRKKDIRGNPEEIDDLRILEKRGLLPMQVELGCGPSIEAGIPPLYYLHGIYYVHNSHTGKFIFGPQKDKLLIDIVQNPEKFYGRAALPFSASLIAEPTPFYKLLAELHDQGIIVGDIITNNFDGLPRVVGLKERYIRRYDEVNITPKIDFDPDAKSLVVVGVHADRRRVEHSARDQGIQVIYVDPEGYRLPDGTFTSHLLESPQDEDLIIRKTAAEFADMWKSTFR
ncbi:hypothetical protein A2774_03725 [Candidatus Roizmanbacteria bacterium RIFCSPHIGHO2_01_FULL_39_12c]|uniref:Uncharacterized protein n=1 Tax=Candidatus Roizmanbacteria bacterium RIFCSPHIGHO2_01_FULL_39_12c TaxID=1802031 RepID=A0A1F7GEH2_9BACT|nr:MAG: hypothetical protein A2774_03725 [Candidatus Roizmanbacteria bacterium RIFCSPHIGHO2_01_FULL_39_12c]OGK47982.1 MAG: hypothetical protein A2963_00125 [Candidatus Roizmanbacteria bacterium RIFCSPLOWO2_01_FULL_40_13]